MILDPTFSAGNFGESTDFNLIPVSDEEYSLSSIPLPEGIFITPVSQDLALIEDLITLDENGEVIDNNLHFDQPTIENDFSESISYTYSPDGEVLEILGVATATDGLDLVGGFGDYEGGNDLTLEVKDDQENVIETFSMTGAGQGTLYKDDEKEYIFFSGTDETTKVDIDAVSDLVFEDYIGDSLSIETTGSIEGGDITLNDENLEEDSGLTLRAGIDTENSVSNIFDGYTLVDFGTHREMVDINYYGQIVGNDTFSGTEELFYYDGQYLYTLPNYDSSRAFGINDFSQIIGEGVSSASEDPHIPFIIYSNGSIEELTYDENSERDSGQSQNADEVFIYDPLGHIRDINNFIELAYYQLNTLPENAPPELEPRTFEDAYFLSPNGAASVNIGYRLLNSDDSRAFGINDLGQVVGINRETNRAFVFNRADNPNDHSVTNLGTLSGGNYSAAYAINNQGQIVGVSTSAAGSRAFIYENGTIKDMGISYVGNPEKRVGIDLNNLGQAVVTSAAGEPFVYQDGVVTNINDWLRPEVSSLGYTITEAKGINDRGQIIAQGTFAGSQRGFLLNPTFQPVNRNINVGNISTFGETVLLEGAEVYLEGESITTQGGKIEFNGKTIVDNNLVIDSSITDDSVGNPDAESIDSLDSESEVTVAGGNITFSDTLNSNSAGDQSLTIKAGAGDITFENTVGDESPLFDFIVEGAGKLTASGDITVDNELYLEVINEITTANITAAGLANISLGTVGEDNFASSGNVTIGNIEALSLEVSNNGKFTAGDLTTSDGGINVISLNELAVGQLTATNGVVDLISGTAGINVGGSVNADRSFFASAQLDVNTKEITSNQNAVILNSSQGAVTVGGSVSANGEVSLASANDVTVDAVRSSGDSVSLVSATGVINSKGAIVGEEDVNLASLKDLTVTQNVRAKSGTTSLVSLEGSVASNVAISSGFNTYIAGKKDVKTLGIRNGGDVHVESELGKIDINGNVVSGGGDVDILGFKKVNVGSIISKSGDVNVVSTLDSIRTGYIRTDYFSRAGEVYLDALRNVKVAGEINIDDVDFSIYTGETNSATITVVHNHLRRRSTETNSFMVGDISLSGSLAFRGNLEDFITPAKSTKTVPKALHVEIFIRVFDAILFLDSAPAHQTEINPITGGRYLSEEEFNIIGQLTEEQTETLKGIWNTKNPKYAPYIPREEGDEPKYAIDTRRGCFSMELKGHLGDNPEYSSGIDPEILEAARKYASDMTGSDNDYLVITQFGVPAFYDGLVNSGGDANSVMPDIPGKPQKVVEAKYGYRFLSKLIDKEEDLPVGFVRDPNLIRDPKEATPKEKNIFRKMITELNGEALVAQACQLNYAATFSNNEAGRSAKELFTFPETKRTNFSVATHFIRPRPS